MSLMTSYLIYIIVWETLTIGLTFSAIFFAEASPWWIVLAIYLSSKAYSPERWVALRKPVEQ